MASKGYGSNRFHTLPPEPLGSIVRKMKKANELTFVEDIEAAASIVDEILQDIDEHYPEDVRQNPKLRELIIECENRSTASP